MNPQPEYNAPTPDEVFRYYLYQLTPKAWVTPTLIAINVLIFVAMAATGLSIMDPAQEGLIKWGADYGPLVTHGEWWRMFTATFLHIGIIHIGMNMWVLYGIGPFVERLYGNVSFLVLYILSGLGGSLLSLYLKPDILSAGASGAIFGLYGGLLGFLLRERSAVPKERWSSLIQNAGIFLVFNLGYGLKDARVDMGAHLGGFITGFAVGWILARPLAPIDAAKRLSTAVMVGVAGLGLIAAGATQLKQVDDLIMEVGRFDKVESATIEQYDVLVHKLEGQTISAPEFAAQMQQKIVAPYRAEAAKISSLKISDNQSKLRDQLQTYLKLRVDGYSEIAAGASSGDAGLVNAGKEKIVKANAFTAGQ